MTSPKIILKKPVNQDESGNLRLKLRSVKVYPNLYVVGHVILQVRVKILQMEVLDYSLGAFEKSVASAT